jgi:hypothetical protein
MSPKFYTLAFLVALLAAAAGASPAQAAVSVSLRPVKFVLDLAPGASYSDSLVVTNSGEQPLSVTPSFEDFVPTGEANINFVKHAGPGTSLVDWLSIDRQQIVLQPKEERKVPFTINVPANAAPGGHFAVFFFNASDQAASTTPAGAGVGILPRIGSLVMVAVPGDVSKAGSIKSFTGPKFIQRGPVQFQVEFQNSGSVHYQPEGKVTMRNIFGSTVAEGSLEGLFVFPGTSRTMKALVPAERYYWGPYIAELKAKDGAGVEHVATVRVWAWPWRITVIPLVGLILVIVGLSQFKRRFKFELRRRD